MNHDVTYEVLSYSLRFKTAVMLRRPHVSNDHTIDGTIIKLLTPFFQWDDVRSATSHVQVANI